jgi:iron-sulfur cluster assembly accessory protein
MLLVSRLRSFSAPKLLTVTETAGKRLKELLDSKPADVLGVKISLSRKGCENLSYTLNYVNKIDKFDEVIKLDASKYQVIVDSKAIMHIIGTTIDFKDDDLSSEFTFTNPNSKSTCGCGQSFSV